MQAKTKRKQKYKSKAMQRVVKNSNGAMNLLKLLARAECVNVSSVVTNDTAVDILQMTKANF